MFLACKYETMFFKTRRELSCYVEKMKEKGETGEEEGEEVLLRRKNQLLPKFYILNQTNPKE